MHGARALANFKELQEVYLAVVVNSNADNIDLIEMPAIEDFPWSGECADCIEQMLNDPDKDYPATIIADKKRVWEGKGLEKIAGRKLKWPFPVPPKLRKVTWELTS